MSLHTRWLPSCWRQ